MEVVYVRSRARLLDVFCVLLLCSRSSKIVIAKDDVSELCGRGEAGSVSLPHSHKCLLFDVFIRRDRDIIAA